MDDILLLIGELITMLCEHGSITTEEQVYLMDEIKRLMK